MLEKGYNPEWVLLAITENTTYDFIIESTGPWLYVGGSGLENYTRIQDAIDNASDGDTVFVFNGTYFESLNVWNGILLCGQDGTQPLSMGVTAQKM